MGVEIERKFLIKNSDWRECPSEALQIKQGYLNSNSNRTVRVRTIGNIGFLTIKGKTINMTRKEFEYEIPLKDAKELLDLCEKPIIEKTRFKVSLDQKMWEIDEFEGVNKGLVVAEIELESENETVELPKWIGKEVTSDVRYYNSNLIAHPYSEW